MNVELPNGTFRIRFVYDHGAGILRDASPQTWHRYIACLIERGVTMLDSDTRRSWLSNGYGWAECSFSDQFVKETGRKIALRRALIAGGFDREERRLFWAAYHGRFAQSIVAHSREAVSA